MSEVGPSSSQILVYLIIYFLMFELWVLYVYIGTLYFVGLSQAGTFLCFSRHCVLGT